MKNVVAIAGVMLVAGMFAGSGFAAQQMDETTVPVKALQSGYVAPSLDKMVRPNRVFINNREIEGYVTLELLVDKAGKVQKAKVLYRTSQLVVNQAVEAASKWTFTPASLNGQPVASYIAYNVPFGRELDAFQEESYSGSVVKFSDMASR